jgi:aspartokinase/homoserine dehydrogenase 1
LLDKKFNLSVCVIANSKKMLVNPHGISLDNWEAALQQSTEPFVIVSFLKALSHIECSSIAVVDCTASDDIVASYPLFIQEGIHIITPNKRANVLPYAEYQSLMELFKQYRCHFLCRTNVGAGLPVLAVLQDLLDCGDSIIKIEGIFSGTLSYLFNYYNGTASFSRVLEQAQILRMTEPDPREDLSGIDVARKLLILARTMGWPMELSDIPVENLVPETLRSGPFKKEFYAAYEKYENDFKSRYEEAKAHGKVLRYVGRLENRVASAALCEVSADHPLALASHSDNIIAFTTHRYQTMPLVIRGPGAGVDVTAMGVFSDILKLLNYLPD